MAAVAQSAVEGVLGMLQTAIKDEATLQKGVEADIQFIKDEMDSMNGFLQHLAKTETQHNDQHRAWMKQVRDVAYLSRDYIELYKQVSPPGTHWWYPPNYCRLPKCCRCCNPSPLPTRHDLAKQLKELKNRVREVGERRLRYGISVPDAKLKAEVPVSRDSNADERKENFQSALEDASSSDDPAVSSSALDRAINLLPGGVLSLLKGREKDKELEEIHEILAMCGHIDTKKMLLCALYAYPHVTRKELTDLKDKLVEGGGAVDASKEVMLLSYSKLSTHYKSCLQYLTTFRAETSISRTVLIRRWVAEGLVASDEGLKTMEEAAERCFGDLVFRGFVQPYPATTPVVPGLKIKSCVMEESVKEFVIDISRRENFLDAGLPMHFNNQVKIRKIAQKSAPTVQDPPLRWWWPGSICPRRPLQDGRAGARRRRKHGMVEEDKQHPMIEMVQHLEHLPKEYRLNVLDLGGCSALKDHHLPSIIQEVPWLKYLSLRNTDVSKLPKSIQKLKLLETLDVRNTKIHRVDVIKDLTKLKHLLAGHIRPSAESETDDKLPLAVRMPKDIAAQSMEILRHVQILGDKADRLKQVGAMKQLRKLGVVLDGNEDGVKHLLRTITMLGEHCLRSLSVCIKAPSSHTDNITLQGTEDPNNVPPRNLESLNIKYFRGSSSSSGSLQFPHWIRELTQLSKITLGGIHVTPANLQTLGRLENLYCLRLHRGSYTDSIISMDDGEFPKLRFLLVDLANPNIKFDFKVGAAPKLKRITWVSNEKTDINKDTFRGLSNLTSLKELEFHGNSTLWSTLPANLRETLSDHHISFSEGPPRTSSLRAIVNKRSPQNINVQ